MNLKKKNAVNYILGLVCLIIIFYSLFLSSSAVRNGDVGFNTDLARDFLLLESIQDTHKLTLLGPRSGGIPGLFHGPLWAYINLPAFLIGHGNPVAVGWFWIVLIAVLIGITYFVGEKLVNKTIGLVAAVLVAITSVTTAPILFNPYGAVIVSPLFFYFFYKYFTESKIKDLLITLFISGILIQFQIAFGGPMLFLATILIVYKCIKNKTFKQLFAYFILLIPLSTYILFDIRHQFLQLHAILTYAKGGSGKVDNFSFNDFLNNRYDGFIHSLLPGPYIPTYLIIIILGLFGYLLYKSFKSRKDAYSKFVLIFFYFYFGYWLTTLLFKGVVWSYYYWPFLPVSIIVLASSLKKLNKFVYGIIMVLIFFVTLPIAQASSNNYGPTTVGKDGGSWLFNYHLAQKVFAQGDKSFGYYIFTPDQYGYSPRYAMNYVAKQNPSVTVYPYTKESITYLLIAPPGGKDKSIGGDWWKLHKVNITQKPTKVISFDNGFKIEKYVLSDKEKAIPSDPNLIDNLIFR